MTYKTIRYPGHCQQMRLLMNDLKLNQDRPALKRILENAVPQTLQDVVIVYAAVTGLQDGELREENYVNKVYPQVIAGRLWSAIQVTTAAGITAVVDLVLNGKDRYHGFVAQEQFRLPEILANRFGHYYAPGGTKKRIFRRRWLSRARPAASEEPGARADERWQPDERQGDQRAAGTARPRQCRAGRGLPASGSM